MTVFAPRDAIQSVEIGGFAGNVVLVDFDLTDDFEAKQRNARDGGRGNVIVMSRHVASSSSQHQSRAHISQSVQFLLGYSVVIPDMNSASGVKVTVIGDSFSTVTAGVAMVNRAESSEEGGSRRIDTLVELVRTAADAGLFEADDDELK